MAGYHNICIDDLNLNILYLKKKKFDFYHIQYVQMIFYKKKKKNDKAHSGSDISKTQESTKKQWIQRYSKFV